MKSKSIALLMILLVLVSTLSLSFYTPQVDTNTVGEETRKTNTIDSTQNFDKSSQFSPKQGADGVAPINGTLWDSWRKTRDLANKWDFNDTSKWGDFAYVEGNMTRLVVGVNHEKPTSHMELEKIAARYQAKIVHTISIKGVIRAVVVELFLKSVTAFVQETRMVGLASYIEPSMKVQAQLVPDDPDWSLQWGPQKIEADWAWNTTLGDPSVLVAVVDTGIDYTHPDLAANYAPLGYDWVNNDTDPMDDQGHGTHVSGTIAAVINNGLGMAGLAQVRIMAEKVLTSEGWGYWEWVASGIIDAVDKGAYIISMSLGGYFDSALVHEAVGYAYDSEVLVVAAAGNDNTNTKLYPAGYDEVIAVAATDQVDNKAGFSNWGDWIGLAAPGVDIYSTVLGGGYQSWSGTSMATPHVSGVAALVWSRFPSKTRDWVRMWLQYTVDDLGESGFDVYYGYGRINARKAVAQSPPEHELIAFKWKTPPYVEPASTATINATVLNFGENNETDVAVQLFANETIVDSASIDFLASGRTATVNLTWNPLIEGQYNVTLYIVPVTGETSVENNVLWKDIYVGFPLKAVVLHSAGNIDGGTIKNWEILSTEWRRFGDTMVFIDYTTLNKDDITYEDIAATKAEVLIISCAYDPGMGWQFTDSEIDAIKQYVFEGHGLIATAGTFYSSVPNNNKLAPFFGLNETVMWDVTGTDLLHPLNTTHPIFRKIPEPFVFADVQTAISYDGIWDSNELAGGTYLALGEFKESAIVAHRGLVYIAPWLEIIPAYYHHHLQLLYNAITWSRYQKLEHELVVSLEAPGRLQPADTTLLNATVSNFGRHNETNVELQLFINSELVDSVVIQELLKDTSYRLSYPWTPTVAATYNITAYAVPVLGEEFVANNVARKIVYVSYAPTILVVDTPWPEDTGALEILGYSYTLVSPVEFASVDLYQYNVLFVGWSPTDLVVNALLARASEIAEWVAAGNGVVALSEYAELNKWAWLPLLIDSSAGYHKDIVHILNSTHPMMSGLTDSDLSHWRNSYHGYYVSYAPEWQALAQGVEAIRPITLAATYGNGRIAVTHQDPDFHIYYGQEIGAEKLLRNMIEWVNIRIEYEHDLLVTLKAPRFLIPGTSVLLNASVRNHGLSDETSVEFQLLINGSIASSAIIPELLKGESYTLSYLWVPSQTGTYNVTAYAAPVPGEDYTRNNRATAFVSVKPPLINPMEGQWAKYAIEYFDKNGTLLSVFTWNLTYLHYISPYLINITLLVEDPSSGASVEGWMIVNIMNRFVEWDSGIYWAGLWYPGWIETDITLGSTINLLLGNATVVDSAIIDFNGQPIECWKLFLTFNDFQYTFWYDKASGVWIAMELLLGITLVKSSGELWFAVPRTQIIQPIPIYRITAMLMATNIPIGSMYDHELAVLLEAPSRLYPEESTSLNATIYNIGLSDETDVQLKLLINGTVVDSIQIPKLLHGESYALSYLWTPTLEGTYNVTAHAPPIPDEALLENNIATRNVLVSKFPSGTYTFIDPLESTLKPGEDLTVTIRVVNVTDLWAWQIKLYYNLTALKWLNATYPPGHVFEGRPFAPVTPFNGTDDGGAYILFFAGLLGDVPGFNGTGVLCEMSFEAKAIGTSTLSFSRPLGDKTWLWSDFDEYIKFTALDGVAKVVAQIPDVAVISVSPSVTEAYEKWVVPINVTTRNEGETTETFTVTAYYDNTIIGTQTVFNLAPGENKTLTFYWNTTGLPLYINYTFKAEASTVPDEVNTDNNILIDGTIIIKMTGDVNGDKSADGKDIAIAALAFASNPTHPRWNAQSDLNQDGKVDGKDIYIIAKNFGRIIL